MHKFSIASAFFASFFTLAHSKASDSFYVLSILKTQDTVVSEKSAPGLSFEAPSYRNNNSYFATGRSYVSRSLLYAASPNKAMVFKNNTGETIKVKLIKNSQLSQTLGECDKSERTVEEVTLASGEELSTSTEKPGDTIVLYFAGLQNSSKFNHLEYFWHFVSSTSESANQRVRDDACTLLEETK